MLALRLILVLVIAARMDSGKNVKTKVQDRVESFFDQQGA